MSIIIQLLFCFCFNVFLLFLVVRQVMMSNMVRASNSHPRPTYPSPIQRPPNVQMQPLTAVPSPPPPPIPQTSQPQQYPNQRIGRNLRAQQARERSEVLKHAQNFLNPQKKPAMKQGPEMKGDEVAIGNPQCTRTNSAKDAKPEEANLDKK